MRDMVGNDSDWFFLAITNLMFVYCSKSFFRGQRHEHSCGRRVIRTCNGHAACSKNQNDGYQLMGFLSSGESICDEKGPNA